MQIDLVAITPDPERVIEDAARTCYQSDPKGAPVGILIPRLLKSGHESPLEHAYATFRINGCSRAMTHQLVRHRLMAVSQQSQRYVNESQFEYVIPPAVFSLSEKNPAGCEDDYPEMFRQDMRDIQAMYDKWKSLGLRNEDARFVLPNACQSEIVISANFREFRHIFSLRCSRHAQWEIREACLRMLEILKENAPSVFSDMMFE